jgi:hypothetical protein
MVPAMTDEAPPSTPWDPSSTMTNKTDRACEGSAAVRSVHEHLSVPT